MREPPPPPFDTWLPWQRPLFACAAMLAWLLLLGAAGIGLAVILQLPACHDSRAGLFNAHCHTSAGVAACVSALVIAVFLHIRFFPLLCQLAYIRRSNYGIDED
jgi:hypothetical protein